MIVMATTAITTLLLVILTMHSRLTGYDQRALKGVLAKRGVGAARGDVIQKTWPRSNKYQHMSASGVDVFRYLSALANRYYSKAPCADATAAAL